ncbi:MAG TPA: acetyl-CoA carboxylase [Solirubrobacterales bacterium]|jgi:biotin carboxyl carrier protein
MSDELVIRAPIPGVFYRRPDPGSPPFAEEGDRVEPGAVIGLVEVMKQFHDIVAEAAGVIVSFEVESEDVVSPGDVVARLEAAG